MRGNPFSLLLAERPRWFLWIPAALMVGIAAYFLPPDEPQPFLGPQLMFGCTWLLLLTRHRPERFLSVPLFIVALGFSAAQFRSQHVITPLLSRELHNHAVEGTIDEIEPFDNKEKLVLSHLAIEDLPPQETPSRVRVSFRGEDLPVQVGDRVRFDANLYPLPQPVMPGGYDFARHFYFRSIGASGFAMRDPEMVENAQQGGFREWLGNLRHAIGEDMRTHMPGAAGAVAAAMTVGETGPIPDDAKDALRNSGLAHMLAIAGLHLGIVAAIVFFSARLLLTLWLPLAQRINAKKAAAVLALISAFVYLSLAGYPIPAQRAFIMAAFLFLAILFDRRGVTLRTLAMAAIGILLVFPESMFGASFEMSFAATLAIVSLYETFGQRLYRPDASWWRRGLHHVLSIVVTSLVATMATAPFVLYHFNRFAMFGLIANSVVVPLATFIIMPGMVLALILMPLGLQAIGYLPLEYGTKIMLAMARWVTGLPHASLHLPSPTDGGLVLCAFGLMWLCLMAQRWRWLGLAAMALGLSTMALHVAPDMLISNDAKQVMARLDDGSYTLLRGTGRSFVAQAWLRAEGQEEIVPLKETAIDCDKALCNYRKGGHSIVLVKDAQDDELLYEACAQKSDLLIAWRYLHGEDCPGPAQLIGRAELEHYGAHEIRFSPEGLRIAHTVEPGRGRRVWQPPVADEDEDSDE